MKPVSTQYLFLSFITFSLYLEELFFFLYILFYLLCRSIVASRAYWGAYYFISNFLNFWFYSESWLTRYSLCAFHWILADDSVKTEMERYIDASRPIIEYIDNLFLSRNISLDWWLIHSSSFGTPCLFGNQADAKASLVSFLRTYRYISIVTF